MPIEAILRRASGRWPDKGGCQRTHARPYELARRRLGRHLCCRHRSQLFASGDGYCEAGDRIPCLVLGGGSNVLVADEGIEGLVVLNRIKTLKLENDEQQPRVESGAGVFFARVARFAAKRGFSGLEWGVAIPGTVGASVVNNAGAHEGDVAKSLIEAEAVGPDGMVRLTNNDLRFGYRESSLKRANSPIAQSPIVITRCWFRVRPSSPKESMALIDSLMEKRRQTQPIAEPSGGSTFKNPSGQSAGALIEQAGLKGLRMGDAEFSIKHANFIVNKGSARANDVFKLIQAARRHVKERFDIDLEPEVQMVGRWDQTEPAKVPAAEGVTA